MKPQLILLGAPGSGKGTQAKVLVKELGYAHISTGDLLRAEIQKESELGKKVKSIMDAGNLVDDQTVLELLNANCDLENSAYIFDGFPRNGDQSKLLEDNVLKGAKTLAIYFDVNFDSIVERITNRRVAKGSGEIYNLLSRPPKVEGKCDVSGEDLIHRDDDKEDVVRNRLNVFKSTIEPVLEYYKSLGNLVEVDASQAPQAVTEQLVKIINQ